MRTHQFADNTDVTLFTPREIICRLRYYLRCRFRCAADSMKGRAIRAKNARTLGRKPWKRCS